MRKKVLALIGCGIALAIGTASLQAQQGAPKPGPEHEKLKKYAGKWDATVSAGGMESKAVADYKMSLGGFWLTADFTGEFAGTKFEGKGTTGYDPLKKKYVGTWIDSMSPTLMVTEGEFDKDGKIYTETTEGPGPDGKVGKMKNVHEFKDDD